MELPFPVLASTDVAGDLVILVAAAVAGGYLASLARQPLVVGYIVGGVVIGPSAAGLIGDIEDVEFVGELGVALLLFTIGLEFPLEQFRRLGGRLVVAGLLQIGLIGSAAYAIALALGMSAGAATPLAAAAALSSTALLVRLLGQRGSRRSAHGRWALGIALVQDMVAVPVLVVLPQLGGEGTGGDLLLDVLLAIGKGLGLVLLVLVGGRWAVPWVLRRSLDAGSRELFLMSVFAIASGIALGSFAAGLSLAFGAFLAGLVTAQSVYASRALQEVIPLRDLFAATFFVSIGVLLDTDAVGEAWELFVTILVWGALGKVLLIFALARWAGFDASRALRAGLLLGQVGEFSFLFAAATGGSAGEEARGLLIAIGAVSMGTSAALVGQADRIERWLLRLPRVAAWWTFEPVVERPAELSQHTVIAGYGEAGSEVARSLTSRGFQCLAVDIDPGLPAVAQAVGLPYIWGDLANAATLEEAALERARLLLLTIPDAVVCEAVVRQVREEQRRLRIVARADSAAAAARLLDAGANAVIQPQLEMGLELTHQALHAYGVPLAEIRQSQAGRRREH